MALNKKEKAYLEILKSSLGVITLACKKANVSRAWHYQRVERNPSFKKVIEEIDESTLDFAETALHNKIKEGDTTATIFFLKTKGKKRGYVERFENEISVNPFLELMRSVDSDT